MTAVVAALAVSSCQKEAPADFYSASVVTLDATDITKEAFCLNAAIDWKCGSSCVGQTGIFINNKPTVSCDNYIVTTNPETLSNEVTKELHHNINNNISHIYIMPIYMIAPGETCYYRAYVRAMTASKDEYVYGEVKSFVVPGK